MILWPVRNFGQNMIFDTLDFWPIWILATIWIFGEKFSFLANILIFRKNLIFGEIFDFGENFNSWFHFPSEILKNHILQRLAFGKILNSGWKARMCQSRSVDELKLIWNKIYENEEKYHVLETFYFWVPKFAMVLSRENKFD